MASTAIPLLPGCERLMLPEASLTGRNGIGRVQNHISLGDVSVRTEHVHPGGEVPSVTLAGGQTLIPKWSPVYPGARRDQSTCVPGDPDENRHVPTEEGPCCAVAGAKLKPTPSAASPRSLDAVT
jgi:hypothetical protein